MTTEIKPTIDDHINGLREAIAAAGSMQMDIAGVRVNSLEAVLKDHASLRRLADAFATSAATDRPMVELLASRIESLVPAWLRRFVWAEANKALLRRIIEQDVRLSKAEMALTTKALDEASATIERLEEDRNQSNRYFLAISRACGRYGNR